MSKNIVTNQAAPRVDIDEYGTNIALVESVAQLAPHADTAELSRIGQLVGSADFQHDAALANRVIPALSTHDRWGNRVDHVEFHPAYHRIIKDDLEAGSHSLAWANPGPGANVERAARFMLFAQIEPGHSCPVSMTHAVVASLKGTEHEAFWVPRALNCSYDPRLIDPADKHAVTFGMAMTEKQGGSDIRANLTAAVPDSDAYLITGHKWFCSAPQSDAFLMLARLPEGVSCFLVPRILPGGDRNPFSIQRLKDKPGNRANASGEIELDGTRGYLVGEPGRGVRAIIEMVAQTRLDCIFGTTAGMRQAVSEAAWHARHRSAFGARLIDQPLMRSVIADLQLEAEAATWTAAHLAAAYDDKSTDAAEFRRMATAVAKYWICKRGPNHAYEAMECLGGNGYTETFPLAMRYREQPVLSVWEGSGNVIVLDVLRALGRDPASGKAFSALLEHARGRVGAYDAQFDRFSADMDWATGIIASGEAAQAADLQRHGRAVVERMALLLQASILFEHAPAGIAESFVSARLGADRGREYGALPDGVDIDQLVSRA
ncbi:MAG: acyl-CoA dehydrogenase family protein [Nakamurella sp.]